MDMDMDMDMDARLVLKLLDGRRHHVVATKRDGEPRCCPANLLCSRQR
jgi:hypothetical protein